MSGIGGDKYRSYLHGEGEQNTKWSSSKLRCCEQARRRVKNQLDNEQAPPNYDLENGRDEICVVEENP